MLIFSIILADDQVRWEKLVPFAIIVVIWVVGSLANSLKRPPKTTLSSTPVDLPPAPTPRQPRLPPRPAIASSRSRLLQVPPPPLPVRAPIPPARRPAPPAVVEAFAPPVSSTMGRGVFRPDLKADPPSHNPGGNSLAASRAPRATVLSLVVRPQLFREPLLGVRLRCKNGNCRHVILLQHDGQRSPLSIVGLVRAVPNRE